MSKLSYDPAFLYDGTAPYVPYLSRAPKGKKLQRRQNRQRFWLTICGAVLIALCGLACQSAKPSGSKWAQREAQHELSR